MSCIAAGLITLLSVIVGAIAFATATNLKVDGECTSLSDLPDQKENMKRENPAAVFLRIVKNLIWRQWLLIGFLSVLFGIASFRLFQTNTDLISISRMLITGMALLAAFIIDEKTHRIPNVIVLIMLGLGALCYFIQFFLDRAVFQNLILTAIIGFLGCLVLFYILSRLTKNGIGMGDVKLLAAQGWLVGIRLTLVGTLFGLLICTAVAVVLLLSRKKKARDTIPFGPFIFAGYMLILFIC